MKRQSEQAASPKPYDFVPIAKPVRTKTVGREQVRGQGYNSGRLTYQILTLSPLFVAAGSYRLGQDVSPRTDEPVVRDFYRVGNQPAIPGSSLKGVVRSVVETISPSCVTVTRLDPRLIPHASPKCQAELACPACSMFGRMSRMSKVTFIDARLVKGSLQLYRLPALFGPRVRQAGQIYQEQGKFKGRKFYYHGQPVEDDRQPPVEVVPPDSLLRGELHFENLSDAELGLLILGLGLDASFALKLGGGKPTCLGSIQIQPGELNLIGAADFLQAEPPSQSIAGEAMVDVMLEKVRAAYGNKLILSKQLEKLREIWRYPNDRRCPDGMY
jgi:CRISPR/Cas system CSM-associated protein Csm3 (group 7 of RAMP superfamily)